MNVRSRCRFVVAAVFLGALSPAVARAQVEPPKPVGLYGGLAVGMGQPMGGSTIGSSSATIKGGFGGLGLLGYGFHPNVGVNAFFHYNAASLGFSDRVETTPDSSGYMMLYGAELRGMLTSSAVNAWAAVGFALGSGEVKTKASRSDPYYSRTSTETDKVDVTFSPVLSFGAEVKLSRNLALGPQFRWYVTGYDDACADVKATTTSTGGGTPVTNEYSSNRCATSTSKEITPHIAFVGLGLTYYQQ